MAFWRARTASSTIFNRIIRPSFRNFSSDVADTQTELLREKMKKEMLHLDINSQIGSCMPLSAMRIGTMIHNIELNPGQGGKLVRAAGTCAKILKEPKSRYCLVRMPSGTEKLIDTRCRATIGQVSNPSHGARKLRKAGQSRWLGRRPVVRGVAMNPVDHPHGGGEGRSKSSGSRGKGSRTPWGKPTKCGFKTGPLKRKKLQEMASKEGGVVKKGHEEGIQMAVSILEEFGLLPLADVIDVGFVKNTGYMWIKVCNHQDMQEVALETLTLFQS